MDVGALELLYDRASPDAAVRNEALGRVPSFFANSFSTILQETVGSDTSITTPETQSVTELLVRLCDTLAPHIEKLETNAKSWDDFDQSKLGQWREHLSTSLSQVIEESCRLKLILGRSGYPHSFFWPDTGDVFDTEIMESRYPRNIDSPRQIVTFTLSPGVRVDFGGLTGVVASRATVVTRTEMVVKESEEDVDASDSW